MMNGMKLYLEYISVGLLSLLVFLISISHEFIAPFIVLWIISIVGLLVIEKPIFHLNKGLVGLILFYVFLTIGMIWTDNKEAGAFDLEVKMSLILFPLLLLVKQYKFKFLKWIILAFFIGLIVSSFYNLTEAFLRYISGNSYDTFLYANLSSRIHPTYMSLYYATAIVILLIDIKYNRLIKKKWLSILLLSYFYCYNFLLLSKAGIIIVSLFLVVFLITWSINNRKIIFPLLTIIGLSGLFVLSYQKSELVQHRVDELIHGLASGEKSNGSTGIRLRIWTEGLSLIKERPLFGYGTGDVKDVLMERYDEVRMCTAYDNKLNAHNQFVQIAISIGLFGLLLFLFVLFEAIRNGYKNNNFYIVSFVIIVIAYALTESLLENQAGTIFFGLFFSLLNQKNFFIHD